MAPFLLKPQKMKLISKGKLVDLYANIDSGWELEQEKGLDKPVVFKVLTKNSKTIGEFTVAPVIGCCGLCISTGLFIYPEYRRTEYSKEFMEMKEWIPDYLGYSAVMATVQLKNIAELKSMTKRGYKIITNWNNSKTNNELGIIFKRTGV